MNKNRDYFLIHRLREHYDALMHNFKGIVTVDDFLADDVIKKAILFDLFQIGELIANQLSKESLSKIDKNDLWGVISVRNYVVHGYYVLEYDKIINSINNDLPRLVTIIENIVKNNYNEELNKMMNCILDLKIEIKPHKQTGLEYGIIKEILAPDLSFQKILIIDDSSPKPYKTVKIIGSFKSSSGTVYLLAIENRKYLDSAIKQYLNNALEKLKNDIG